MAEADRGGRAAELGEVALVCCVAGQHDAIRRRFNASVGGMISPSSRSGFSLIELLVALVLLSGGLAVAAGVSLHAMRAVASGGRRSVAAALAAGNLESLASMPCANRVTGSATNRGVSLTWSVLDSAGMSFVQQSVAFVGGSGLVTKTFETLLPC